MKRNILFKIVAPSIMALALVAPGAQANEETAPVSMAGNNGITLTSTSLLNASAMLKNGQFYVWGRRAEGLGGNGEISVDYRTSPTQVTSLTNVVKVTSGDYFIHALQANGDLYGWGKNKLLGNGNGFDQNTPVLIMEDIVQVSDHMSGGYALDHDGQVWAWGDNRDGQMGIPGYSYSYTPLPVDLGGEKVRLINAGAYLAFAITQGGHVYGWGLNNKANMGIWDKEPGYYYSYEKISQPTRIPNLEPFAHQIVQIGAGDYFGIALLNDGRVLVWGDHLYQQILDGGFSPEPVEIMNNVSKIHVRLNGALFLTNDGEVYTFGNNTRFGLPMLDGHPVSMRLPVGPVVDIGGGDQHVFYKTADGKIYGVGFNDIKQIDRNTVSNRIDWPGVEIELSTMQ